MVLSSILKKSTVRMSLLALSVLTVLTLSSTFSVNAQQSSSSSSMSAGASANWLSGGNYPYDWNYNSQNVINASNVQNLALSWVYPLPSAPPPYQGDEGVVEPVLMYQGIAYFITNFHRVYALTASNGGLLWYKDLPLNYSQIPSEIFDEGTGHYHMIWFSTQILNQPLVWIVANDFHVFALNALTGDIKMAWQPVNESLLAPGAVTGNYGQYSVLGNGLIIDDKRGIVMFGPGDTEGTSAGRGFWEAYNVSTGTPKYMWQDFIMPPQDGKDPGWSLSSVNNMTHAYIFNGTAAVDLKSLSPSVLNSTLYGDWGTLGFNGTHSAAGTNTAWGGEMALDPVTGMAYVATSQVAPDWNATFRPGPNLWSDSILSINDTSGKIDWGFQTTSHDLWDYDCSWSVVLGNTTVNGQSQETVFKGCKNGYVYALNAQTGAMIWDFNPPSVLRLNCPNGQPNGLFDPRNATEMHQATECNSKTWVIQNPTDTGGIESDPSYNPVTGMVYVATYNAPANFTFQNVAPTPGAPKDSFGAPVLTGGVRPYGDANTTIYGLNGSTGKPVWSFMLPSKVGFRGGVADSGGVLYVPAIDGNLYMLNDQTGKLISKLLVGDMNVEPAIGQDANGNYKLIIPSSSAGAAVGISASPVPGNVFAIALPKSNSSSGSPGTPSTSVITTTVQGSAGSSSISTVTTVVTSNSGGGISSTAFYGVVVVAVILLITTAFFAMRRKPAATGTTSTTTTT
jgi:outer membrane protein assembly factor BamB